MIGPGWAGDPEPARTHAKPARRRRVAVVTGSRADFGLLRPVMAAVDAHHDLDLLAIAAGAHLIPPAVSFRDVKAQFPIADSIPMQKPGRTTRPDDAEALGTGISRLTRSFGSLEPDWVVVLGDRIEAFAAAAAANVGGWALAHLHGGDRAEGVADESMRHAISKLAHLHLPATQASADRLVRMGEKPEHVHVVGSPAIDDLATFEAMPEAEFSELGSPRAVVLLHPTGRPHAAEEHVTANLLDALAVLKIEPIVLAPNHDPGRAGVLRMLKERGQNIEPHRPRAWFVSLLKRIAMTDGVLVGNSSAGLIEAPALGCRVVDIGPRQIGRERPPAVRHADDQSAQAIERTILDTLAAPRPDGNDHPYGDGHTGERVAALLASVDPNTRGVLAKLNAY
ncbi:MAG: UDP-N-acetylglucosamine 2-epimerase [Phycisphaerales bacterium]